MAAIWELDNLNQIERDIRRAFDLVIEDIPLVREDITEDFINRFSVREVWVVGPWANDTATEGEDIFRFVLILSVEGAETPSEVSGYSETEEVIEDAMEGIINTEPEEFDPVFFEEGAGVSITASPINRKNDALALALGSGEGNRVVNLTDGIARRFEEGTDFDNLPIETIDELRGVEEEEPEEPEEEEPEEEFDPELTEEELLAEEFPDIPSQLRVYAVDEDVLEIPSGVRWEKKVTPRDMYPFEVIQATARPTPVDLEFSAPVEMTDEVIPGIGEAISAGFFAREGPARGNQVPPSTYPRTNAYIRNYLRHQGPAYPLMIYNDFLVYLGYVNQIHRKEDGSPFNLNIGTYRSFREYFHVLNRIPEETNSPELVIPLSQNQASARGLETVPDHPTIEGAKAPWLARRQWYDINLEAFEHPAWNDPYTFLHGTEEEGEARA